MKSIQIRVPRQITIQEEEIPVINDQQVLLKLVYVGLCGSDLNSWLGKNPMVKYPVVPGHEIAGRVVEKGSAVPDQIQVGQAVTVNPYTHCGTCAACLKGRTNACQHNQTFGVQRDGALSEYLAVEWTRLIQADQLSEPELALVEPLSVGFHAVRRGRVNQTDTVLVLGCGMIGAGAIIAAAEAGARVIAADIDPDKLLTAARLGASHTILSQKGALSDQIKKLTSLHGPDVIIEAVGRPETYLSAISDISFCGRVVCIGYAKEDIAFTTRLFVQKELDILGSRNALPEDFQAVIRYLNKKTCPVSDLITRIIAPEETGEGLQHWAANPGKIMKILVEF